jgi:hypothetical protein
VRKRSDRSRQASLTTRPRARSFTLPIYLVAALLVMSTAGAKLRADASTTNKVEVVYVLDANGNRAGSVNTAVAKPTPVQN